MNFDDKFKYRITLTNIDWVTAQEWCQKHIGEFDVTWYKLGIDPAEYILEGETVTHWYFKHEKDAIHFKLRWQ